MSASARLPAGYRVRIAPGTWSMDRRRTLVGGSPLTALRVSDRAVELLASGVLTVDGPGSAHLADRLLATNLGTPDLEDTDPPDAVLLSVVLPVRDRPEQLDRALVGLAGLRCIVVDDASRDPDAISMVARRHGAEVVHLTDNLGPAGARNVGLAAARTPYVAFVDSDVRVGSADLLALSRHFTDPAVAIVAPKIVGVPASDRPRWYERYDAVASSLTLGDVAASVRPGAAVGWVPSACIVARADALGDGFDPRLRVGEDVDLVWRMVAAGHRVRYDPGFVARHDTRPTVLAWLGRKVVYGSGSAALGTRHGSAVAPAVITPSYGIAAAALLCRRRESVPMALAALLVGTRAVRRVLPAGPARTPLAAGIAARGFGWALRQEVALVLRHWWPVAVGTAVFSRSARRAVLGALVVDGVLLLTVDRSGTRAADLPPAYVARRLDDLAYGAGLWWGAVRSRSVRALAPRVVRSARRRPR